jgi:uncharacterized membrane protein YebE (DUF533 family)
MGISLDQHDWLKDFIDLVLEQYDMEYAATWTDNLPEDNRGQAAIFQSLNNRGISFGVLQMDPSLSESQRFPEIKFLSTLKHQLEITLDVATAQGSNAHGLFGHLAFVMLGWAFVGELDQADALAEVWREVQVEQRDLGSVEGILLAHYESLGAHLKAQAPMQDDPLLALPINQGVAYFDLLLAGELALGLFNDERLQRNEIEQALFSVSNDKMRFIEANIALAWSNGLLEAEERNLIKKQIAMLGFEKKTRRKLVNLMITPSTPKEFARKFSSKETGLFVLRQMVIASYIDGTQDHREKKFLQQTAQEFGLNEEQFATIQREMKNFLDQNRDALAHFKRRR